MILRTSLTPVVILMLGALVAGHDDGQVYNEGDIENHNVEGDFEAFLDNGVTMLSRDNFHHFVKKSKFALVEFYITTCVHCRHLEPEYIKVAKQYNGSKTVLIAKVNVQLEQALAQEFMVDGFPTLLLFENGIKTEKYEGERTSEGIISYLEKRTDENWKPPPNAVVDLTDANFQDTLKNVPLALVLFYADYCQHCKKMKPDYINAAATLKKVGVPLYQIDGIENKEMANEYNVKGWPTLFVFRNGKAFQFRGRRNERDIVEYMKQEITEPSRKCKSFQEIQNRISRTWPTVVGVFNSEDSNLYFEFFAAATYLRSRPVKFIHTLDPEVAKKLGVPKGEAIIVKKATVFASKYEKNESKLAKMDANGDEIAEFIRESSTPLVGERNKENLSFMYSKKPLVVVYYDAVFDFQYQKQSELVRSKVLEVARKHVGEINFAVSNEDLFEDELKAAKLDDTGTDVNVVWYDKSILKYKMTPVDHFESSDLEKFIASVKNNTVKPVFKSAPISKQPQAGPVYSIVADNFFEKVLSSLATSDVVLLVYTPWCGHCTKFKPIYESIAKKRASDRLFFAKIDATNNDLYPGFQVKGFPTIFFIPASDKKNPVLYDGDRSATHFNKFLDEHLSSEKSSSDEVKVEKQPEVENEPKEEL